jgi:ubiquitin C-terminal hydrolase
MEANSGNLIEEKGDGLSGLANMGNTCYLNSCMQVLSHTEPLNLFLKTNYMNKINRVPDSILLIEWNKLRNLMWSENCTIAPNGFISAIRKISSIKGRHLFTGFDQNDVSEFLLFMIDSFHNSLKREVDIQIYGNAKNSTDILAIKCYNMLKDMYTNDYSEMIDIFFGVSVTQIKSLKTGYILSCRPEPFCVLSLSIPSDKQNVTLFDCLDEYCKVERLENENAYLNEATNEKEDVDKGVLFWSFPQILIIDIKRYNFAGKKLNNIIDVPLENVSFSKYINGYNSSSYIYDLYGICNHSGGTLGGHYTSYVKAKNSKWYEFNDTMVREINQDNLISNKSYCFFYRKKNR